MYQIFITTLALLVSPFHANANPVHPMNALEDESSWTTYLYEIGNERFYIKMPDEAIHIHDINQEILFLETSDCCTYFLEAINNSELAIEDPKRSMQDPTLEEYLCEDDEIISLKTTTMEDQHITTIEVLHPVGEHFFHGHMRWVLTDQNFYWLAVWHLEGEDVEAERFMNSFKIEKF